MLANAEAEELSTEPWWPHGRMSACVRLDAVEDAGHKSLAFQLALEKTRAPRPRSRLQDVCSKVSQPSSLSLSPLPPLPLNDSSPLSPLPPPRLHPPGAYTTSSAITD